MRRFFSRVTLGLTLLYVILISGYVFFRGFPQDGRGWIYLLNAFALYLFIPTIPLFLFGLLTRSRASVLLCVIPTVLFLALFGELFLPRQIGVTPPADTFKVLTHNLQADNPNQESAMRMIALSGADIVCLQELSGSAAEAITTQLKDTYPYQALIPDDDFAGVGVISRFPIKSADSFEAGHFAQQLVIDVRGREISLFNVHPQPPKIWTPGAGRVIPVAGRGVDVNTQSEQLNVIRERMGKTQGPAILVGDFNTTDQTRQYEMVKGNLVDSFRESGYGFGLTFPAPGRYLRIPFALIRIDYLFHSSELTAFSCILGSQTASDHLPVLITLGFNSSAP
jgi:endonuclease/exonuclease/phosphatase (EEP) superfamily protein YafD